MPARVTVGPGHLLAQMEDLFVPLPSIEAFLLVGTVDNDKTCAFIPRLAIGFVCAAEKRTAVLNRAATSFILPSHAVNQPLAGVVSPVLLFYHQYYGFRHPQGQSWFLRERFLFIPPNPLLPPRAFGMTLS